MDTTTQQSSELDLTESDQKRASDLAQESRRTPRTTKGVVTFFAATAIAGAALAGLGILPRAAQHAEVLAATKAAGEAHRVVNVASPTRDGAAYELRLPGTTAPLQSTVVFARTSGYLKAFKVDIGDRVKAGQLLAEIESPETDHQLDQARATLEQSRANLVLVKNQFGRVKSMFEQRAAAQGELDDLTAQYNAATAAVRVGEAAVSRLETEQSFQKVVAPFDGVVTQRNVELGSLVTSGSANSVTPLFRVEQNDVLKVYFDAPQSAAPSVAVGQTVQVEIREYPGKPFEGKIVRTAGSIDPTTRTLRTEVHLPNPNGELFAGMYAQVHLNVADPRKPLRIASASLVIDAAGTQVVTVDAESKAQRKPVTLGRDFGRELEVTAGLTGNERLVLNPRDELRNGDLVDVH